MTVKRYSTGESVPAHTWPAVEGEVYVHSEDYEALQALNAELLDVLGKIKMRLEAYLDDDRDMAKSSMWLCLDYAEKAIANSRSQA